MVEIKVNLKERLTCVFHRIQCVIDVSEIGNFLTKHKGKWLGFLSVGLHRLIPSQGKSLFSLLSFFFSLSPFFSFLTMDFEEKAFSNAGKRGGKKNRDVFRVTKLVYFVRKGKPRNFPRGKHYRFIFFF